jgi:hypothetical protein
MEVPTSEERSSDYESALNLEKHKAEHHIHSVPNLNLITNTLAIIEYAILLYIYLEQVLCTAHYALEHSSMRHDIRC